MSHLAIIEIADWGATRARVHALADALSRGGTRPSADYHLGFADAAQLLAELPPKRLQTLRAIKRSGPTSIYAVAKQLGRNYSNVHADVHKLIEHGLVERDQDDRVFVPWDDVVVRVNASLLNAAA